MNFRNRKLVISVRTIFGLFMVFSGVSGIFAGSSMQGIPEPMIPMMKILWATGIFQMIKVTEIVGGAMLVFGFLPALGAIFLAPIAVGIIIVNARTNPAFLPMGIIVALFNAYMGYAYWDKFKALFEPK
jgi:putative oxidoreductase